MSVTGSGGAPQPGRTRRIVGFAGPAALLGLLAIAVALPDGLAEPARLALFAFGGAVILWIGSALGTTFVAMGALLFLVAGRAVPEKALFGMLDSEVVWLLVGTFIIGAAFERTGLSGRIAAAIGRGAGSVGGLCWRLTAGIIPLAFVIPSTSGRAALLLPLFRGLAEEADEERVSRVLALLIPGVILISTAGSLVGAGSHLIANDLLQHVSGRRIGFGAWMLYGLPFAAGASALFCFVVTRMFLDRELRRRPLRPERDAKPPALSGAEWRTIAVSALMIGGWVTDGMHPLGIAAVAMLGSFVLCVPGIGVLPWKEAVAAVDWNLILFVGAALALGNALISTGAADWVVRHLIRASGLRSTGSPLLVLGALLLVSLSAHLYFTSHTARTAALLPPLLLLGHSLDLGLDALAFVATVGMDYSLTFPVSSKALLLFEDGAGRCWEPVDLLRLSAVMLPLYALLMVACYLGYWAPLGLSL